ncbi:hypothetical protein C4K38_4663 [Pseudomonas chlororaphis subsp. piscium]|nr:hypothetical protein C4K38_4663 [Pseudomonas chlororaphis subsp. piscium]
MRSDKIHQPGQRRRRLLKNDRRHRQVQNTNGSFLTALPVRTTIRRVILAPVCQPQIQPIHLRGIV